MRGAGGTQGGAGSFFLGLIMMVGGFYLLLNNIRVDSGFGFGRSLHYGNYTITSGYVLLPFIFGVGMIFYNSNNYLGWFLAVASLIMLIFGVITNIQFRFDYLSLFELLSIFILFVGGIGLFLGSLRNTGRRRDY